MTGPTVKMKSWAIGLNSDPYQADLVTVKHDTFEVAFYSDALGSCVFELYAEGTLVKERRWSRSWPITQQDRNNALWADLMCKRYTGITLEQASDQFNEEYMEDPIKGWM